MKGPTSTSAVGPRKKASPTEFRIYDDGGPKKLGYAPVWMLLLNQVTKPNAGTPAGGVPPISKTQAVKLANAAEQLGEQLSVDRVEAALRRYGDLSWFEPWLVLGETPPPDVVLLDAEQVKATDEVCNYVALMANAERVNGSGTRRTNKSAQSYNQWIRRIIFKAKSIEEWHQWLVWLWSRTAPEGWYIVPANITELRLAESGAGHIRRSKVGERTVVRWRRSCLGSPRTGMRRR